MHPQTEAFNESKLEAQAEKRAKQRELQAPEFIYDEEGEITYLNE